jgi:hypothetical protein
VTESYGYEANPGRNSRDLAPPPRLRHKLNEAPQRIGFPRTRIAG